VILRPHVAAVLLVAGCGGGGGDAAQAHGGAPDAAQAATEAAAGPFDASIDGGAGEASTDAQETGSQSDAGADAPADVASDSPCGPCPLPSNCGGTNGDIAQCGQACLFWNQGECEAICYDQAACPHLVWPVTWTTSGDCTGTPYVDLGEAYYLRDGGRWGCQNLQDPTTHVSWLCCSDYGPRP
jgi:hypothetical protein